jgi:hypothetical protein
MTPQEALDDFIRPALNRIALSSPGAETLVLATFIHESKLKERRQIVSYGPPVEYSVALGLGQMEPVTHDDCWASYLVYRHDLARDVHGLTAYGRLTAIPAEELVTNDRYAAAMCRVRYRRASDPLPPADDLPAIADYWKRHYNTAEGAGTVDQFLADWHAFMG